MNNLLQHATMSSPLSIKRKKANDANRQLKKPFVSPMRIKKPEQTETPSKENARPLPFTPSTLRNSLDRRCEPERSIANTQTSKPTVTPARTRPSFAWSAQKKTTDPEEIAARQANSALEVQIRKIQKEVDTFIQAEKLLNSSTDTDLAALKDKWRAASQAVAEELFGTVKERVCSMGGVGAWREMEKKKYERSNGMGEFAHVEEPDDDADCEFDSAGEELPEAEQEYRKKMKRQAKQEAMDAMDPPDQPAAEASSKIAVWQETGQDDDASIQPIKAFNAAR
jgi:hypothetical protein